MGKKKKSFSEILESIKSHRLDFDPRDYIKDLIAEFRKPSPCCCNWCLVDYIYSVDSATLFPFFADLISSGRDGYEIDTAIDWLLRQDTDEARQLLIDRLPEYLGSNDVEVRNAAIRGLRNLDTKEVRTFLWNARSQFTFSSEQETARFRKTIEERLAKEPHRRVAHIIFS